MKQAGLKHSKIAGRMYHMNQIISSCKDEKYTCSFYNDAFSFWDTLIPLIQLDTLNLYLYIYTCFLPLNSYVLLVNVPK